MGSNTSYKSIVSVVKTITKIVMCRNILDALKPLYFQLKIAGFLTFKVNDDTGYFEVDSKYLIVFCVLNSTLSIVSLAYYIPKTHRFSIDSSLSTFLIQTLAIAFGTKVVITDIFIYINRQKTLYLWNDVYLMDKVFLIDDIRSNYKIIKYSGSAIILIQIFLRIIVPIIIPSERKNFGAQNILLIALLISNFRSSLISNEFITLRIVLSYYFNNYFVLLQKINTSATQSNQSKPLVSLYFHLCKLSRDLDRVTSPQILVKLMESFLTLNVLLFHVISLVVYVPDNEISLHDTLVLYSIFDNCVTIAYIIIPGYFCINMVNICYLT